MFGNKSKANSLPNDESRKTSLIEISGCNNPNKLGDIVFVHGLGGHPITTWHHLEKEDQDFWLYWLGEDLPEYSFWTFGYQAEFSNWKGKSMPRFDRARNLVEFLDNENIGKDKPLIFVTHSLGGLLIKEVMRIADTHSRQELINQTKGIIFIATPHNGSHLANIVGVLSQILSTTISVSELTDNNPWLRDLDAWYRERVNKFEISTKAYYETLNTLGYRVVDEGSADPKLEGVMPIPVDANHIDIARPKSRQDLIYKGVKKFILDHIKPVLLLPPANKLTIPERIREKSVNP